MNDNQNFLSEKQQRAIRNNANNANAVRAAANVASNTANPYAKAIGTGIKVADRLSGGRASEKLGKAVSAMNKMNGLKGRMAQRTINKMSENGTADRISKAANAKNGRAPLSGASTQNTDNKLSGTTTGKSAGIGNQLIDSTKKETEEQASDGGGANFKTSFKIVKWGLIASAFAFPLLIFICLLTSASQVYINSIGLGNADSLTDSAVESKINKKNKKEGDLNREINDDNANKAAFDYFIDDNSSRNFRSSKLDQYNLVQIASYKRKYNEATLEQLEDFYPTIIDLENEYDENLVYDFFFKMYNLYKYYDNTATFPRDSKDKNPILDLPLLMATLRLQSDDWNVIFKSNLEKEDRKPSPRQQPVADYAFDKDWSSTDYLLSRNNSTHDMEILAQHMVSRQVKESCVDASGKDVTTNILKDGQIGTQTLSCGEGETYTTGNEYYAFDNDKYREFLKEFIEKKYHTKSGAKVSKNDNYISSGSSNTNISADSSFTGKFISWLVQIAKDDSHGYSQKNRNSLVDFDCSSLVYYGLLNSGFTAKQIGSYPFTTNKNQRAVLKKAGFQEIAFTSLVPDRKTTTNLLPGDILWTPGHTEVYVGNNMNVGAHSSETGSTHGNFGDQTGKEISVSKFWDDNWQYVYRYGG